MRRRLPLVLLSLAGVAPIVAHAQVTVTVDASADRHAISPLIYGANFAASDQIAAGRLTLTRWGGNSTTRYNWQTDVHNAAFDNFFENLPGCWDQSQGWCSSPPSDPKTSSTANAFLAAAQQEGLVTLFTMPTIGFVPRPPPVYSHPFPCGCPKSALPKQDQFDPYDANCGNCQSGGRFLTPPAPTTTSIAVTPQWAQDWAAYLTQRYGASNGRRIYEMDNEPALWSSTHHDVRPQRLGYDELWQRQRDYALAVLAADPTALIAGFEEWGWPNYFCSDLDVVSNGCNPSSPDRAKHGGEELTAWFLDQAKAYEQQNGKRILHALDLHYYPQGGNPPSVTRSLWDPSYTDPSWIGDTIRLIPRMHDWVNQHYPGTLIGISEYDFYHHDEAVGAVTYAEVLGIFGREGLDYATAWSAPGATEQAFAAFRLYRNYDGAGAHFADTSVRATVGGAGVQAYAAIDAQRATVALANEGTQPVQVTVALAGFSATGAALYQASGAMVVAGPPPALAGGQATVTVPGQGIAMLVLAGSPSQPVVGVDAGVPFDASVVTDGGLPASDAASIDDAATGSDDTAAHSLDGPTPASDGSPGSRRDGASSRGDGGGGSAQGGCGCGVASGAEAASSGASFALIVAALALARRRRARR